MSDAELKMLASYIVAIHEAGGNASLFVADINNMTVREMINSLAVNGVRFKHIKE